MSLSSEFLSCEISPFHVFMHTSCLSVSVHACKRPPLEVFVLLSERFASSSNSSLPLERLFWFHILKRSYNSLYLYSYSSVFQFSECNVFISLRILIGCFLWSIFTLCIVSLFFSEKNMELKQTNKAKSPFLPSLNSASLELWSTEGCIGREKKMLLSQNAISPDTLELQPIPSVDHASSGAGNRIVLYGLGLPTDQRFAALMHASYHLQNFYSTMPAPEQMSQKLCSGAQALLFLVLPVILRFSRGENHC